MKINGFKEYLQEHKLDNDQIEASITLIDEFDVFLSQNKKSADIATYEDLHNFSAYLIENKKNSFDNYIALLRFGYFMKNNELIIASMENIDGSEVMVNFFKRLETQFGEKLRNEIFEGIEVPPLGLHPKKKPEITKKLIERFLTKVGQEKCVEFLADGLRDKYTESYKKSRELFLKSKSIDEFLERKQLNFIKQLETHLQEKTLFFTQEIDEKVLEYVKNNPTVEAGVRDGNSVIITKIPYMTKDYLNETDERKKRYYYCHCPWVREALIEEEQPVSPAFCNCSGGYYKNQWEAILDQPVKIEVVESVLKGDKICKFALELPSDIAD